MPTRLGALGDDQVTTRLDGADRVVDLAAHAHHEHTVPVTEIDDLGRHAQAGHEGRGAAVDDHLDLLSHTARHGREQVDAEGLGPWQLRTAAISDTIVSLPMVEAPRQPNPPAAETAAASSEYETPPMPASMTGCSIPSRSVSRVCMGGPSWLGS